jgi:hypothetical protein
VALAAAICGRMCARRLRRGYGLLRCGWRAAMVETRFD